MKDDDRTVAERLEDEINRRTGAGQALARKYPELIGLEWKPFLLKAKELGLELDFVTAVEMFHALAPPEDKP